MPIISQAIDFIFPPLCVHCGREGAWLCSDAQHEIGVEPILYNPIVIPGVNRVVARGSYDCEPLAQLIQKLKYHYWTAVRDALDEVIIPLASTIRVPQNTLIVPVPLHAQRCRERGFNQAQIISHGLSRITGLPTATILRRQRYTAPQAQLSAQERTKNIIGAFDRRGIRTWPTSVIIVDDVITTGSTMAECASVLQKHGAKNIVAVALAKG